MSGVLHIIKAGSTHPAIAARFGDFHTWTIAGVGSAALKVRVVDAEGGADLPLASACAGVIVTGSHSMITDDLPWSLSVEKWVPSILEARVPFLGICYGHQLLARAAGGEVGYHPAGMEFGTVPIELLPSCSADPLFGLLPRSFPAHATHSQSVLRMPREAVLLAGNSHEPHHAFRLGSSAWGVQFHPEYTVDIMRSYISEDAQGLSSAGLNPGELLAAVVETPHAASVLTNFARLVEVRETR